MSTSTVGAGACSPRPSQATLAAHHETVKRKLFKAQDALDRAAGNACVAGPEHVQWDYVADQLAKAVCACGEALQAASNGTIELRILREEQEAAELPDTVTVPALANCQGGERPVES